MMVKCVAVGDTGVGKSSLRISYTINQFPNEYFPAGANTFSANVLIGNKTYTLGLFDTTNQEECDRLRPLSYPQTDVVLICFSIISPTSFENIKEKWLPEVNYYCSSVPFLIVATQVDLRENVEVIEKLGRQNQRPISSDTDSCLARELGAAKYVECSALTQKGLKDVFQEAIVAALEPPVFKKERRCVVV